jgi:hypothetical protein
LVYGLPLIWSLAWIVTRDGSNFNQLNTIIMEIVKSVSSYVEILRDLRGCGSIALPVSVVPDFVKFCNRLGVYPCGGALCGPESAPLQWLYID